MDCLNKKMDNEQEYILEAPRNYSAEDLKIFREKFAADLKLYRAKDRRYAGPLLGIILVGFAAIVGAFVIPQQPVKWIAGAGIFLVFAGIGLIAIAASSLQRQLKCPACHNLFITEIEEYCPECGSASLESKDWIIGGRCCNACGKNFYSGKNRNFRYKACTHCGIFLDEKGL